MKVWQSLRYGLTEVAKAVVAQLRHVPAEPVSSTFERPWRLFSQSGKVWLERPECLMKLPS